MHNYQQSTFNLKEEDEISPGDVLLYVSDELNAELVYFVRGDSYLAMVRKHDMSELKIQLNKLWQIDDPSHPTVASAWLDVLMIRNIRLLQLSPTILTLKIDEEEVVLEIPIQTDGLWSLEIEGSEFSNGTKNPVVGLGLLKEAIHSALHNGELERR